MLEEQEVPEPRSPLNLGAAPELPNFTPILNAISLGVQVLNSRFLLLLGLIGAFWLGWSAVQDPAPWRLLACFGWDALVFIPLIWLSYLKG